MDVLTNLPMAIISNTHIPYHQTLELHSYMSMMSQKVERKKSDIDIQRILLSLRKGTYHMLQHGSTVRTLP